MTHDELLEHINKDIDQGGFASACGEWFPARSLLALRAVVELHKHHGESWSVSGELRPTSNTCEECGIEFPYPCPTIRAIEKELG